jgi:hypothetical protein
MFHYSIKQQQCYENNNYKSEIFGVVSRDANTDENEIGNVAGKTGYDIK